MATQTQTIRRPPVQAERVHDYLYGKITNCLRQSVVRTVACFSCSTTYTHEGFYSNAIYLKVAY